jgi:DNA-binding transcriptional regulator YiaG
MGRASTGDHIRAVRLRLNLSQAELAETLGVSRETVSRWENDSHAPHPIFLASIGTLETEARRPKANKP